MTNNNEAFLLLIRLGIGTTNMDLLPDRIEWKELEVLAEQHGLSAILVDGIEKLPSEKRPPKAYVLSLIGTVLQAYEHRYDRYVRSIAELAHLYNSNEIKMMVLKGYACGQNWPKPNHRPCGDIDIWLFGDQQRGDELLIKSKGIKIDRGHHHHTIFNWQDFLVENHYDFTNVAHHKTNEEIERLFKSLGADDSHFVIINNEKVYIPSPNLHVLFLLHHLVSHFTSTGINIRQILDYALFVKKNTQVISWNWLLPILEKFTMVDFFNCVNAICVEDLGFPTSMFPSVQFSPFLKDRVLDDIFSSNEALPQRFLSRIIYKIKRWRKNTWKRQLCFRENNTESFMMSLWLHIKKPSSI